MKIEAGTVFSIGLQLNCISTVCVQCFNHCVVCFTSLSQKSLVHEIFSKFMFQSFTMSLEIFLTFPCSTIVITELYIQGFIQIFRSVTIFLFVL